jgi:cell division protein ZapA
MTRRTVTVEIGGETYTLRTTASPEYARQVAAYVDATLRRVGHAAARAPHRAAVLAALLITDELFQSRARWARRLAETERRAQALTERLRAALDAPPEGRA